MFVTSILFKKKNAFKKDLLAPIAFCIILVGVFGYQVKKRKEIFIVSGKEDIEISEEIDFSDYEPFSPENLLKSLDEESTLVIYSDYPRLDGATALYPVYAAIVEMVYPSIGQFSVDHYVSCSTTIHAFERLINNEIDIFFGAQPSKEQQEKAKEKGVELVMTPIAKDAFVFFVNKDNPIDSLTIEQLQDIYTGKIVNWKELGGKNEVIKAFQRPADSGSQTIMIAKVMQGKTMTPPLKEEYAIGMGEIIVNVANYRNKSSAIGYSFRFYAIGMKPNDQVKLLAVNGVEPTIENIRNGKYALTVSGYAITTGNERENTKKLIEWILSEQGQRLIEECGYVSIK
jgi:ABC-type phosphate transport system, periplasmic component